MPYISTALRNNLLPMMRELFNRGCAKLKIYSGAVPASADAAETGTLLTTITNAGSAVKVKQKIRFTPTPGTANAASWNITLNGVTVSFTDDGTPSAAEICTGLYNAWRAVSALASVTTPACSINAPDVYQKFAFTDNSGTLDIEAATAGVSFDYSASVSGAGAGTGSWATSVITADSYGLQFEAIADISAGILEKLASQEWKGTNVASGTATHWRLVLDSDTGVLSTTEIRIQGLINTANSDMNRTSGTTFVSGEYEYIDPFPVTLPAN